LALNYTTFDNFFSPILAETYPNGEPGLSDLRLLRPGE
jgi:hypothetical protein